MLIEQTSYSTFYAKYTLSDVVKNLGWKFFATFLVSIPVFLFWIEISAENLKIKFYFLPLVLMGIWFLGLLFTEKELKIEENQIGYRNFMSKEWKFIRIEDISHVCYYKKPIERGSSLPKAILYPLANKKGTTIHFLINQQAIYQFLSILHDYKKDVLIFDELKNIDETNHYVPSGFFKEGDSPVKVEKYIFDVDDPKFQDTLDPNYKKVSVGFYFLAVLSILKVILFIFIPDSLWLIFNLVALFFSFVLANVSRMGIGFIKWFGAAYVGYFSLELVMFLYFNKLNYIIGLVCATQLIVSIVILYLLLNTKKKKV